MHGMRRREVQEHKWKCFMRGLRGSIVVYGPRVLVYTVPIEFIFAHAKLSEYGV